MDILDIDGNDLNEERPIFSWKGEASVAERTGLTRYQPTLETEMAHSTVKNGYCDLHGCNIIQFEEVEFKRCSSYCSIYGGKEGVRGRPKMNSQDYCLSSYNLGQGESKRSQERIRYNFALGMIMTGEAFSDEKGMIHVCHI
jgi:hypothetical protein